jgi:hypothetical protein
MVLQFYIEGDGQKTNWFDSILQYIPHQRASFEESDFIISNKIPYGCTDALHIQTVIESYNNMSKQVIVFLLSDYNEPVTIPSNVLLFRSGMYCSKRYPNEYLIPYVWVEYELQGASATQPLPKRSRHPLIGFCGSIASHPCRIQHLNLVKRQPTMKTNFIIRTQHWAGKPHDPQVVQEFVKNIQENHFTVCSRGAGNWSARFYQVLSLGRIPIVVNTDMVMPLEDKIAWSNWIVLCQSEQEIPTAIQRFWNEKDIVQAQEKCKQIYEEYLSPKQWCAILAEDLLQLKNEWIRNAATAKVSKSNTSAATATATADGSN